MSYDKPISPSGMKLYDDCPFLFKDNYILGNKSKGNAASDRGTQKHDMLERYFNRETPYPSGDSCLATWQPFMSKLLVMNQQAEGEVAVDQFWRPVAFDDPSAWFRGKKDLTVTLGSVKEIYDWKTGKIYPNHVEQGRAYVALDTDDVDRYIVKFAYLDIPHHVQDWEYDLHDRQKIREKLDRKIEIIRLDEVHKPTPGDKCHWCDHSWRRNGKCTAAP